jgi:hypothetical protein
MLLNTSSMLLTEFFQKMLAQPNIEPKKQIHKYQYLFIQNTTTANNTDQVLTTVELSS